MNNNHTGSTAQIGEAVRIRIGAPPGSWIRSTANAIVHAQDHGVNNRFTTNNFGHSKAAQNFISKYGNKWIYHGYVKMLIFKIKLFSQMNKVIFCLIDLIYIFKKNWKFIFFKKHI